MVPCSVNQCRNADVKALLHRQIYTDFVFGDRLSGHSHAFIASRLKQL